MTIRDEFIDLLEEEELRNRIKNECLPLPLLYAFQSERIKNEIIPLLDIDARKDALRKVMKKIVKSEKVIELRKKLRKMVEIRSELELLLNSAVEDI